MSTIEEITTRTNGSKCFTVLDANMGYFQIELTKEFQALTTFNTPFGRYKYLRLPMGISVAPEIYQRAMSELLAGLAGVEVIMDDILIHAPTTEMPQHAPTAGTTEMSREELEAKPSQNETMHQ